MTFEQALNKVRELSTGNAILTVEGHILRNLEHTPVARGLTWRIWDSELENGFNGETPEEVLLLYTQYLQASSLKENISVEKRIAQVAI